MSSQRKILLIFYSIILQVISFPVSSFPHIDYSFDPSMTVSPSIRSSGPGSVTERRNFWQNRIDAGVGTRIIPFRWHRGSHLELIAKKLKIYKEYLKVISYISDDAPKSVPDFDFRIGINYTLNWD